jgi:chromosome segregation ATPase
VAEYWPTIVTLLIGVGSILVNLYIVRAGRGQRNAETVKTEAETEDQTITTMRQITAELRMELKESKDNHAAAELRIVELEAANLVTAKRLASLEMNATLLQDTVREQAATIDRQSRRIAGQNDKITEQNKRITHLEAGVRQLNEQIQARGDTPVFTLDKGA